jgi:hypothetical protein
LIGNRSRLVFDGVYFQGSDGSAFGTDRWGGGDRAGTPGAPSIYPIARIASPTVLGIKTEKVLQGVGVPRFAQDDNRALN